MDIGSILKYYRAILIMINWCIVIMSQYSEKLALLGFEEYSILVIFYNCLVKYSDVWMKYDSLN